MNKLFDGLSFEGKSMLDIGAGDGLFSLYAACMRAKLVVSLEPELAGSSEKPYSKLMQLGKLVPTDVVYTPEPVSLQEFDSGGQTFDIILSHSSINHLDEESCRNLQYSEVSLDKYRVIFKKISELAGPGARLIISDCSRRNFWHDIGLPNPFTRTINWEIHQSPYYWSRLLSNAGFANPTISWLTPIPFYNVGRFFFHSRVVAYFTTSFFCLTMDRQQS